MCRLFAQISPRPASPRDFLVSSEFSLLRQSNYDKGNPQKDGWGVAYWNESAASVSKSPKPAFKEAAKLDSLANRIHSRVVIGHLRAASNPRGIPRSRLITMDNTQPFSDGSWVFAHNGTLEIPDAVAERLGPLRRKLKALNDSEVYFWLFRKWLARTKSPAKAFKASVREIWEVWNASQARYPNKKGPYTSLNAIASDGRGLYVMNHFVRKGMAEHGVCNPDQPWSVMSLSRRGGRLIVASENMDRGRWSRLRPPEIVSARIKNGRLAVTRERFKLTSLEVHS